MRFRHPDGTTVHLAYCSNVHPAEEVDGVLAQLDTYARPSRERLGRDRLGIGLWLADDAALALDTDPSMLEDLRVRLATTGCEVVTLNGFPYAGFHDEVVKRKVYRPDWTEPARREHTLRRARLLTRLLSDDVEVGTLSTLPLGWREGFDAARTSAAVDNMAGLAEDLAALADDTGRRIALAVEPEPGCRVETTTQLIEVLGDVAGPHLGACVDLCHLAVQFEDGPTAVAGLGAAGVPIHKAQVSAGLRAVKPGDPAVRAALAAHADSPFLHQTRERSGGTVRGVDDLPEALAGGLPGEEEWRVHVHLPLHHSDEGTTRPELEASLAALVGGPTAVTAHLELETYTWGVLPEGRRPADAADPVDGLVTGIAAELSWAADHLTSLGLTELP